MFKLYTIWLEKLHRLPLRLQRAGWFIIFSLNIYLILLAGLDFRDLNEVKFVINRSVYMHTFILLFTTSTFLLYYNYEAAAILFLAIDLILAGWMIWPRF
jgi:hypothetical protein